MAEKTYLDEATVEQAAVEHLSRYYSEVYGGPVYSTRQFSLKQRKGVADGFIAVRDANDELVTASIEAKSIKTLGDIIASPDERFIGWVAKLGAIVAGLLVALIGYFAGGWVWMLISASVIFLVLRILLPHIFRPFAVFQRVNIIDERLLKYEANERWLALPEDAYSELSPDDQYKLIGRCLSEGFGIVLVGQDLRGVIVLKAATSIARSGRPDYLDRYARGQEVVNSLLQEGAGYLVRAND